MMKPVLATSTGLNSTQSQLGVIGWWVQPRLWNQRTCRLASRPPLAQTTNQPLGAQSTYADSLVTTNSAIHIWKIHFGGKLWILKFRLYVTSRLALWLLLVRALISLTLSWYYRITGYCTSTKKKRPIKPILVLL